ncbi:terpene synthase family protein [Mongoliitalea lutea]|uniref:Terpene synthase n=1 Tax=Mongoliitalea lutea TaxID=849756 RepID=A0A8J3CXH7_9BACT|nr:terpene synthase family protein [Mongoliitalea lutea]GHB32309.1 hypothetical protein GCM10008106_11620 [Mongoliitalea lutea]
MKHVSKSQITTTHGLLSDFDRHYPKELVYWDSLEWQLFTWLNKQGLLKNEVEHVRTQVSAILKFAPRLFPYTNPRLQLLFAKLFTLLFIMDDQADHHKGNFWEEAWNKHLKGGAHDLIAPCMEVIQLINLHRSTGHSSALVLLLQEFIYAGMQEKVRWNKEGSLHYQAYLDFKTQSSGVKIAFECLHIAHPEIGLILSPNQFALLKQKLSALIILSNDLDSYPKELAVGDTNNLVILYQQQRKIKLSSAIANVRTHLKDEWKALDDLLLKQYHKFHQGKESPYSVSKTIKEQVEWRQSITKVLAIFFGCKHWASFDTGRYQKR